MTTVYRYNLDYFINRKTSVKKIVLNSGERESRERNSFSKPRGRCLGPVQTRCSFCGHAVAEGELTKVCSHKFPFLGTVPEHYPSTTRVLPLEVVLAPERSACSEFLLGHQEKAMLRPVHVP